MSNNSADLRQLMNLMESVSSPTLLEGWLDGIKHKLAGHMGRKARQEMADRFSKEWYKWLGQTRRKGTMDDMVRFMLVRVGFNQDDVKSVLSQFEDETGIDAEANIPPSKEEQPGADPSEDDPVWDDDEGRPLPTDLNAKLSDYGTVNQVDQETVTRERSDDIVGDVRDFMTRGKLDMNKITTKLGSMKKGQRLILGKKSYFLGESIKQFFEDSEDFHLSHSDIAVLMDLSAARVNDSYLLDGPTNDAMASKDGTQGTSKAKDRDSRNDRDGQDPENANITRGSGRYDPKEMIDILKSYNYPVTRIESLSRKVNRSKSVSDMSDQDMDELSLIGYAFFHARTKN